MINKTYWQPIIILSACFSPIFSVLPSMSAPVPTSLELRQQVSVAFPQGSDRGAPPRSRGAGTRGPGCGQEPGEIPITALMPANNVATTVAANPTVYMYVPKRNNKNAEFAVFDLSERKVVYETTFPLRESAGIVKVTLPTTVALKPGNNYMWHFGVICNTSDLSQNEVVQGMIERIALTPEQQTKITQTQQPLEQAKLYAAAGVWNEAVSGLEPLRNAHPAEWSELLNSVGLEKMTEQPVLDCCSVENELK